MIISWNCQVVGSCRDQTESEGVGAAEGKLGFRNCFVLNRIGLSEECLFSGMLKLISALNLS